MYTGEASTEKLSDEEAELQKLYTLRPPHLEEESDNEEERFSTPFEEEQYFRKEQYQRYMKVIDSLNPSIATSLIECEEKLGRPCLLRGPASKIISATKEFYGYPLMVVNEEITSKPDQEKKILSACIKEYNNLLENHFFIMPLSKEDYAKYMNIIKDVHPLAYEELVECEKKLGSPCLKQKQGESWREIPPSHESHGYSTIVLASYFKDMSPEDLRKNLSTIVNYCFKLPPDPSHTKNISEKEQLHVLKIIKKLAPELHAKMITSDPKGAGTSYVIRLNKGDIGIAPWENGLPLILMDKETLTKPIDVQHFIVGHELSHYLNGDSYESPLVHKRMSDDQKTPREYTPGKKVEGQLPFNKTFQMSLHRLQEYKADEDSILTFKTSIDAALDLMKEFAQTEVYKEPMKTTFKSTHPLSDFGRKNHLESLRVEVEHRSERGQKPQPINWTDVIVRNRNYMRITNCEI